MNRRQRRQLGLEPIDQRSSRATSASRRARFRDAGRSCRRIGEAGAEREQIALDLHERAVDVRRRRVDAIARGRAGVQLVDLAVRVDPGVGLADARAVEQRCFAGVTGARVDFHGVPRLYDAC